MTQYLREAKQQCLSKESEVNRNVLTAFTLREMILDTGLRGMTENLPNCMGFIVHIPLSKNIVLTTAPRKEEGREVLKVGILNQERS